MIRQGCGARQVGLRLLGGMFGLPVGFSFAALSGLYATFMKAVGASRRVFQLLDRVSQMPPSGKMKPLL